MTVRAVARNVARNVAKNVAWPTSDAVPSLPAGYVAVAADDRLTITFPNWAVGGTYDITPDATPKLTLSVTSAGYNSAKTLGTITQTLIGTVAQTETANGSDVDVEFWLSENVYSGDTITVTAIAGWAVDTAGGGENAQTFIDAPVTNSSTFTYSMKKPTVNWTTPSIGNITAGNFDVEVSVTDGAARNGKQVPVVSFTCTDSAANTFTVDATAMVVSSFAANDRHSVVVYKATIDVTNLVDGNATVRATAYPFVGDATTIRASDGTDGFVDYKIRIDKAAAYDRYFAWVDPGNAGGAPGVDKTRANVVGVASKAYGDIGAAIVALRLATSHGDAGNCIVVVEGQAGAATAIDFSETASGGTASASDVWLTVEPRESTNVLFTQPDGNVLPNQIGGKIKVKNTSSQDGTGTLTFDQSGGPGNEAVIWSTNDPEDALWIDFCNCTGRDNALMFYQFPNMFWTGGDATDMAFTQVGTNNMKWSLIRGGIHDSCVMQGYSVHGIQGTNDTRIVQNKDTGATIPAFKNVLVTCFGLEKVKANVAISGLGMGTHATEGDADGAGYLNVLIEHIGTQPGFNVAAADSSIRTASNICLHHVQIAGEIGGGGGRANMFYNWPGTGAVVSRLVSMIGCAWADWNIKGQDFTPADATRNGNDALARGAAGLLGNISVYGSKAGAEPQYAGLGGQDTVTTVYVDDLTATTGGGDYHTASTGWDARIPAGRQVVPFDLEGIAISTAAASKAGVFQNAA